MVMMLAVQITNWSLVFWINNDNDRSYGNFISDMKWSSCESDIAILIALLEFLHYCASVLVNLIIFSKR